MSLSVAIKKRFPNFCLDVALEHEGGKLALLGASGSGKTLTLSCIAGVQKPDEGRIVLNGRVLFDSQKHINLSPQERGVGLLFQSYALFPNMTVEQNLRCGLARIRDRHEREKRLIELIFMLRICGLEKSYPHQLSGGQQQRVALARVLGSEPKLLMLDEPFSALDESLKWMLEQELFEMLEAFQTPVLYITHDMREVKSLCDRACVLDCGRSQGVMTPKELLNCPATAAAARLGGFDNVVAARKNGANVVFVEEWGISLNCQASRLNVVNGIAVRAGDISINAGMSTTAVSKLENTIECQVLRVVEDVDRTVILCRPKEKEAIIQVAGTQALQCVVGTWIMLSIAPSAVLLLY